MSYELYKEKKGTLKSDLLVGDSGSDMLVGLRGKDFLDGRAGNDHLDGGVGNDFLQGGLGDDVLVGDKGRDTFRWDLSDMSAGMKDSVFDTTGSRLQFDDALLEQLLLGGKSLDHITGSKAVGGTIDAANGIAFQGSSLLIDLDGNGSFDPSLDARIELVGNSDHLVFAGSSDMLILK